MARAPRPSGTAASIPSRPRAPPRTPPRARTRTRSQAWSRSGTPTRSRARSPTRTPPPNHHPDRVGGGRSFDSVVLRSTSLRMTFGGAHAGMRCLVSSRPSERSERAEGSPRPWRAQAPKAEGLPGRSLDLAASGRSARDDRDGGDRSRSAWDDGVGRPLGSLGGRRLGTTAWPAQPGPANGRALGCRGRRSPRPAWLPEHGQHQEKLRDGGVGQVHEKGTHQCDEQEGPR